MRWFRVATLVALLAIAGAASLRAAAVRRVVRRALPTSWLPEAALLAQLEDMGAVAVVGGVPARWRLGDAPLVEAAAVLPLAAALRGADGAAVVRALREARMDALLVRSDASGWPAGSVAERLRRRRSTAGLAAHHLAPEATLYEPEEMPTVGPLDARRLVGVARVILQGATPPTERMFPEPFRRAYPAEVAVILRAGHEPVLWRSVRGGSVARALVDASYAVYSRWSTRQQQAYGALREALDQLTVTLAIFHDRGTLGARTPEFVDAVSDPAVHGAGFELAGRWEWAMPPSPWSHAGPAWQTLQALASERDVPAPGIRRPEVVPYRFRALQMVEEIPGGTVVVFDPE